ncbi:hypothetical protein [Sulfitobacter sp. R18_1]|uniref:hypothetical protein n=1 Tax=Sulfitobacter sp. R18_1 TaxID=2821104 RepID=UPI001ADBDB86|nr:hypothetical protein [Sulfitobacter sp. R18_1]MBO9428430.1 hypothetical protein [Sulfitobacter sp. R18_1]
MAQLDFATVQVYEMDDLVEVSFPFDPSFSSFLKTMKGRWEPKRKCWQVKPQFSGKSAPEIVEAISAKLDELAPPKWDKVLEILRGHGCVAKGFEVFAGKGGVRLDMPLGHPCHHYLKKVDGLVNTRTKWQVPAKLFSHEVVQQSLTRIYNEDFKKYDSELSPVEERCLIGLVKIPAEQEEAFSMKVEGLIAATPTFLTHADPAMSDIPLREVAFEILKMERTSDKEMRIRLEYAEPKEGYEFLKKRVYAPNPTPALDFSHIVDDDWIQRRS